MRRSIKLTVFIDIRDDDVSVRSYSEYAPIITDYQRALERSIKQTTEPMLALACQVLPADYPRNPEE